MGKRASFSPCFRVLLEGSWGRNLWRNLKAELCYSTQHPSAQETQSGGIQQETEAVLLAGSHTGSSLATFPVQLRTVGLPRDRVTHCGLDPPASAHETTPLRMPTDQSDPAIPPSETFLSED